mgnify:CR=1 FL=1
MEKLVSDLKFQLKQTTEQFEKFKHDNNEDRLFCLNMDIDVRKRILSQVKDIMQKTDWSEIDKETVEL